MLLIILIVITVIGIGLIIHGVSSGNDETAGCGLVITMVVAFLGWMLAGLMMPQKTVNTEIVAHVLHDQNAVHLSVGNTVIKSYDDVANFNFLADKSEVKAIKTENFNMYGGSVSVQWNLANKQ